VAPKVFITTGTGGGIGGDVSLGDVVIAGTVRFDCRRQFHAQPWATASYRSSALPHRALAAITPALTSVNAAKIPGARATPQIFSAAHDAIVTTDFFAFDDSTNHYQLQGLGRACDMGDAMVATALQSVPGIAWYAIRNASDPQIPNPGTTSSRRGRRLARSIRATAASPPRPVSSRPGRSFTLPIAIDHPSAGSGLIDTRRLSSAASTALEGRRWRRKSCWPTIR
jgi:hypothetical protein